VRPSDDTAGLTFRLFATLPEAVRGGWSQATRDSFFLSSRYLEAIEQSGLAGLSFRYAVCYDGDDPVGVFYFQLADLSSREMGSILNLSGYGDLAAHIGDHIHRLLFMGRKNSKKWLLVCGSLLVSGNHGYALTDERYRSACFAVLPGILRDLSHALETNGEKVVAVSVKDFYADERESAAGLGRQGFRRMVIDPNMIVALDPAWRSFDDYLDAMSAKYRLRANNALKKIKHMTRRTLTYEELKRCAPDLEALYMNVQKKAPVRIVRADSRYFLALKKALKDGFVVRVFETDGRIIAFTTGFIHGTLYDAHFIGIDYHDNRKHSLYLNILYDFVEQAIAARSEKLFFGRTALEIKSTVGARAHALESWLKINSRILQGLIAPFIPKAAGDDWIQRNPFR